MVYFKDLLWNDWNIEHVARHGVNRDEVRAAVDDAPFMTRGRDDTYQLVGQTDAGRYLFVVLASRGVRVYYVVSAREATRSEQRTYRHR